MCILLSLWLIFGLPILPQPSLNRMTWGKNAQPRKEPDTVVPAIDLMNMDIDKMSERDFRVAIKKSIARLDKSIRDKINSLKAEMRSNQNVNKNTINKMQFKLETQRARVKEREE